MYITPVQYNFNDDYHAVICASESYTNTRNKNHASLVHIHIRIQTPLIDNVMMISKTRPSGFYLLYNCS